MKTRMNKAKDKVEELRTNNASSKDIQEAEVIADKFKKQHDDLASQIKDIKGNEKEKRLKKRFESN